MRLLDFADGFSSPTAPSQGLIVATSLAAFSSDAAYVTAKGSAATNADCYYNTTDHVVRIYRNGAWEYLRQPAVTGTRASPSAIVAGTGVVFAGKQQDNVWFVQGSGGAVTVTVNPRIAAGAYVGQRLTLIGRSDTNTVTLANGNGLSLNGDATLGADSSLTLEWDGTNWREVCRNDL
jgi:hypothetical protein